jgi:3-hydroxyacyl-CoA dehydrogenase
VSARAKDDVNLDDLTREELVALVKSERKTHKRRLRSVKNDLFDTQLAHFIALGQRDKALTDLNDADHAIMVIVENSIKNSKKTSEPVS